MKVHSYTHLQVEKPYFALNSKTYITIRQQELKTCKGIGYEFYCEELFILNTSLNTAAKAQYILTYTQRLKKIVKLTFTTIKDTSLLVYWMVGMKSPYQTGLAISILYAMLTMIFQLGYPVIHIYFVSRSVLCNCGVETENHFLLESLAACHGSNSKLVMYFTVNTAFIYYPDQFVNLTDTLEIPIIKNKTSF